MIEIILLLFYTVSALMLALYTIGQAVLLWQFGTHRAQRCGVPALPDMELPAVTVQLPIYNEQYVAARLLDAVAHLAYPPDKLHIQILDDSTDATTRYLAQVRARYPHLHIDHIRRADRTGYKAGALAYGLAQTRAPFIAIFDADFIPPPDFLQQTIPYLLADECLGVVQTRWTHLNRYENWLTQAQALSVDAHFIIEQTGRNRAGWPLPFNGTGGVWRADTIRDAGGWSAQTLTEDLDLSFRAQLRGWNSLFLPDVTVPGELPPQMAAYRQQQGRWAKGNAQNLRRLLLPLWRSDWSWSAKIMGTQHLLQYAPHPLMLLLLLLTPPLLWSEQLQSAPLAFLGIISLIPPLMYGISQRIAHPQQWAAHLLAFPALLLVGTGMIGSNSWHFITGLFQQGGAFQRTPKFAQGWPQSGYALRVHRLPLVDIGLLLYSLVALWVAYQTGHPASIPYLLVYALSFAVVSGWQLIEQAQLFFQTKRAPIFWPRTSTERLARRGEGQEET